MIFEIDTEINTELAEHARLRAKRGFYIFLAINASAENNVKDTRDKLDEILGIKDLRSDKGNFFTTLVVPVIFWMILINNFKNVRP